MKRDWTQVGEEETAGRQDEWAAMFAGMTWYGLPCTLPAMPGLAIKGLVQECHIHNPRAVGYSHEAAPFGLIAVEAHYSNGVARVYALDRGADTVVLCSDFWPTGEAPPDLDLHTPEPLAANEHLSKV